MSDHDLFSAKMKFKRSGKCPICDLTPSNQSGRFTIKRVPAGTEFYNFACFDQGKPPPWDPNAPLGAMMVKHEAVRMVRLEARDSTIGIGMTMHIGAVLDSKEEPVVLVSEPSVYVMPDTVAALAKRAEERAFAMNEINYRLAAKLREAEQVIALLRSPRRVDRKRGKRLARRTGGSQK